MSFAALQDPVAAFSEPDHGPRLRPLVDPSGASTPTGVRRRPLGESGLRVFPLGLAVGGAEPARGDTTELRVLDRFVDGGGELVEPLDGRAQSVLGAWARRRGIREQLVLAATIDAAPRPEPGSRPAGRADTPAMSAPGLAGAIVRRQVDAALRRLQTDRIELLHLRLDDGTEAFDEVLLALDEAQRAGKVRALGGSGIAVQRMVEARVASGQLSLARMVALRHPYGIGDRAEFESSAAPVAAHLGLAVLPSVRSSATSRAALRREARRRERIAAALRSVAVETGADERSIALAWLLSKPDVAAPMVVASTEADAAAYLAAPRLTLSRAHLTELDRVSGARRGARRQRR